MHFRGLTNDQADVQVERHDRANPFRGPARSTAAATTALTIRAPHVGWSVVIAPGTWSNGALDQ